MSKRFWMVCITVVTSLLFFGNTAMADLVLGDGGPTGQWFNPERDGEGFYVEIIDSGGVLQISVAMYSYDAEGNQLWLIGNVLIDDDAEIVPVPVFQIDGPVWGADYDPADRNFTEFGTITVRFPTCDTALFSIQSNVAGLSSGNYSLVRLTDIVGIDCIDPPSQPTITPGLWTGHGICFTVAADGMSLVGEPVSTCDGGASFDSNLDGLSNEFEDCKVSTGCEGPWPIENGQFACVNQNGELAVGTFSSGNSASGMAFEPEGGAGEFCTAPWSAEPGPGND